MTWWATDSVYSCQVLKDVHQHWPHGVRTTTLLLLMIFIPITHFRNNLLPKRKTFRRKRP